MPTPAEARSLAQMILDELQEIRQEVASLHQFANLLGEKGPNQESYMESTTRLLGLIVAGTEETHANLKSLHALMTTPGFTAAMRLAMHDT